MYEQIAIIGEGKNDFTTLFTKMHFSHCDLLQTHKYENCKDCYRFDTCCAADTTNTVISTKERQWTNGKTDSITWNKES
jgi:hypothetical protein